MSVQRTTWIVGGLVIASLLMTGVALAATSGPTIDWWVIGGGGGSETANGTSLGGTVGQWMAGSDTIDTTQLDSGFWVWVVGGQRVFLPLVLRQA